MRIYYLQSRYYDSEIGRFINADESEILLEEQKNLLQYNLYAYCFNNSVNMVDSDGRLAMYASKAAFYSGIALGGAVGTGLIIIGGILFVYYAGKLIKKGIESFQEHRTTKNGSKTRLNDKHTKPRPGRQSEKKKQKSGWKRPR